MSRVDKRTIAFYLGTGGLLVLLAAILQAPGGGAANAGNQWAEFRNAPPL